MRRFAETLWRDAEARAACLELQDAHGADILLALLALHLAANGRDADATLSARAQAISAEWSAGIVAPLRAARRALKPRDAALYARARALELEIEYVVIDLLTEAASSAPAGTGGELARRNLSALIGAPAADSAAGRQLLARWSAGAGATIESRGEGGV